MYKDDLISVLNTLTSNGCPKCGQQNEFTATIDDIILDPTQMTPEKQEKLDFGKLVAKCKICGHRISNINGII